MSVCVLVLHSAMFLASGTKHRLFTTAIKTNKQTNKQTNKHKLKISGVKHLFPSRWISPSRSRHSRVRVDVCFLDALHFHGDSVLALHDGVILLPLVQY